jgi:Uncharacterized protein conserved in bacteria (DUF2325)
MRLLAQKGLSKVGGGPCRLTGRDADLIYSVTRDFGTRNPLSEIFQRDFESRHKNAIARLSSVKSPDQLALLWTQLVDSNSLLNEVGSTFWAMLTHPCGVDVQGGIIYEMGAWVLNQMRTGAIYKRQTNIQAQVIADLKTHTDIGQERLLQTQALLETERSEKIRLQCELNGLMQRLEERELKTNARHVKVPSLPRALSPGRTEKKAAVNTKNLWAGEPGRNKAENQILIQSQSESGPQTHLENKTTFTPINVLGKRILCVGGLTASQTLYRRVVEKAGGQCQFHDGGLEDSTQRLPFLIESADVVICQTGCVNHEAYQHVKRLCKRTGKPCVFLERPSVSLLRKHLAVPTKQILETPIK